jgi:hypothetical protein
MGEGNLPSAERAWRTEDGVESDDYFSRELTIRNHQ